ncbi:hypothetical protein CLDAP_21790 [Caldilinea aerophila DSM 14535 = NBRC 104270]|uniref:Uncharacterized protein n=1 Tax=Caldilinea aerophila (strain DSM 14535 / JCM 11387 / NBRC 104270 / STL-6-O1) TaxID=926550 RepID=I0I4N1_CALAS|nr:hypothetical protein CLDAP_21790 [Caldilinea aerophila DSM 14535 = NBRC 104270]
MSVHSSSRKSSTHTQAGVASICAATRHPASMPSFSPLHPWRGLFVAPFYFYFSFYGYRETPTRVGATMTPG